MFGVPRLTLLLKILSKRLNRGVNVPFRVRNDMILNFAGFFILDLSGRGQFGVRKQVEMCEILEKIHLEFETLFVWTAS